MITQEEEAKLKQKWLDEYNAKILLLPSPQLPTDKTPYIVLFVIMATMVITGIVLLEIFSDKDNAGTIGLILAFGATITTGILTYQRAAKAESKSVETHLMVNSRLSQWMDAARAASEAKGEVKGIEKANARSDKLAAHAQATPPAAPPVKNEEFTE